MLIGIPKEIKNHEYRVGITPRGVKELKTQSHKVIVETSAGAAIGYSDQQYIDAGAEILSSPKEIYGQAEMIVKVKELQTEECSLVQPEQILFCYLHLAAEPELTELLLKTNAIGISYETLTDSNGQLPLLIPMSEVAGRVAVQVGARYLQKAEGGKGILLGGVPGVAPGKVVILGGGYVGVNAAIVASGMGAKVTVIEKSIKRIRDLQAIFDKNVEVLYSTADTIEREVVSADLLIGAVLIPGAAAPLLVSEELVRKMQKGSVIVDVAVDQGGCIETIHPTSHEHPTYEIGGVIHYGVTNMPAAAAFTSTQALENATLPYMLELANKGYLELLKTDKHFREGVNIYKGKLTNQEVATSLNMPFVPLGSII
jgi:alanine dehydrogenase